MSAMQGQLNELRRDMMSTLELIKESVELLMEEVTEVELCILERNAQTLREEFDRAAELEEMIEFRRRCAEERYGTL